MSKTDGGPAFPSTKYWDARSEEYSPPKTDGGMTLRDYFAGQALVGSMVGQVIGAGLGLPPSNASTENTAATAYEIADAMLAARMEDR